MKAMIFAAGLGTRLKPLTDSRPKALVPVNGKPMLEWVILRLIKEDIKDIIVNVHHYAEQIINFLNSHDNFRINIEISHEQNLLDTGGGVKKTAWFFEGEKDFLVHNCDILSSINLKSIYNEHTLKNADATLCVSKRKSSRYLLFDMNGYLCGWKSLKENKILWADNAVSKVNEYAFNGIHILSQKLLKKFKAESKYPIIAEYLRLAKENRICVYDASNDPWIDLGKPENLKNVSQLFSKKYFSYLSI